LSVKVFLGVDVDRVDEVETAETADTGVAEAGVMGTGADEKIGGT